MGCLATLLLFIYVRLDLQRYVVLVRVFVLVLVQHSLEIYQSKRAPNLGKEML